MKEINPPRKDQDEINVQRAFWVSIIYTIVAASSVGLAIFLIIRNPVWQVYTMAVIAVSSLGFDLAAVIYIRRGQPALGLKILYWSGLFTLPLNALLFSGVSSFLAAIILVVGFVNVFYLFPKSWRRRYQFGPIVAAVAIFILDLVNPPFRVNMGNVSGNFGWIVLGFIVVAVLVLANRQLWTGGILRRQSSQGEITTGKASRSRSLAATLSLAFLGLSFAVLFIATFIQSISAFQVQRIAIANQQQIVAQEAANTVTNLIQEKFNALEAAVQLNDPASKSTEEQETILETILGFDRAIQMVVLLTPEGVPSATATRLAQSTSVNAGSQLDSETQAKLFAKTQAGERYISPVYVDNVTNEPFVVIATPDIDVFGDFQGILMAQVNLKFMWDLVDRLEIGNTGQAYVIDKQGNLIAFGDVTRVLAGESVSHLDEVAEFINDTGLTDKTLGEISRGIDGTMVTATYVPLGEPDWAVVTELPLSEAFQGIFQNLGTALFVLLASSVLAGLVGGLVAQRLAVPLVDLTNTAIQVAQGDLNLRAAVQGPTEIITLSEAFNSMTSQLRELVTSLELRIVERTRALETSTEVGRRLSTILDQRELVREVVEQVRSAFNYYHAQIYLLDEPKEQLVLVGGTGKAGQAMLEQGHSIPKERGLVGRAADTNIPVLVPNVERSIGYEIITADTVADVFERESSLASTKSWYANHISTIFTDLQAFAERVAQKQAAGDQLPKIGYILYGLNDFLETMKIGAEEAGKFLGIEVEILSADFDPDQGVRLFRKMIADKKDGLIVTPHFPEKWVEPIQEAVEAGIPVLTANLRCPDSASSVWFGQDSYQSGLTLSRELQRALSAAGKTSGEIVVASAREIQELHERYAGLRRGLEGTAYTLSEFYGVAQEEQQNLKDWEQLVDKHPDMIAAVGLASMDLPSLVQIKKRLNAPWVAAGYDLTIEVLEAIREGIAQVTIGQHPYMQGYLPVLALGQHFIDGTTLQNWIVESWQSNPLLPETRAEVAIPIAIGENVLGVLDVQDDEVDGLGENDVDLLQSIANQVAVALQNARLYQHTQQQVAREALIANINQQIRETTDMEDALKVAVRELGRALGTETSVRLVTKSNGNERE